MDCVFRACRISVDFMAQDADTINEADLLKMNKNFTSTKIDLKMFGGNKVLSLNTVALEQKIAGSGALLCICKHLGKNFFQFTEAAVELCATYLNFDHSREIRSNYD